MKIPRKTFSYLFERKNLKTPRAIETEDLEVGTESTPNPPYKIESESMAQRNDERKPLTVVAPMPVQEGINSRLEDGTYPLHAAIRLDEVDKVYNLIQAGARPDLKDWQGLTAYDYAILSENTEMLRALLPEEACEVLNIALQQANTTFFQQREKHDRALQLVSNLQTLIQNRVSISEGDVEGLHGLLIRGDIKALNLLGKVDFSKNHRSKRALTPLHTALLSKNEGIVSMVLDQINDEDLLAKDDKGLTPLHYACMLGLSESLEAMLARCKNNPKFDINAVHPRLQYSLANLAIAANHPRVFAILSQNGAKIYREGVELCPADLFCILVKERDPLKVSTSQYILAAFNVLAIAADSYSPEATLALMLASVLANAAISHKQGGLRGLALYWGGESLSLAVKAGLARVPLISAVVDIYRVASIATPCLNAISRSIKNIRYETGKSIQLAAVNSVIIGSSVYRIRDSIRYALHAVSKIPSYVNLAFNADKVLAHQSNLQQDKEALLRRIKDLENRESGLQNQESRLQEKKEELLRRIKDLEERESDVQYLDSLLQEEKRVLEREKSELGKREGNLRERDESIFVKSADEIKSTPEIPLNEVPERHITFGTTYLPGNKNRDAMSKLVNDNQKEYAQTWGLTHRVVDRNLLKDQCTVSNELRNCSPYWNKIKVLKDWLDTTTSPKGKEEWYIMADDDMVVTNMKINPYKAIDQLRGNHDTSFIVVKDIQAYTGNPTTSVNTGLLFVRKDDAAKGLINRIWEGRNFKTATGTSDCPTYGVCDKQQTFHEQEVLSNLIKSDLGEKNIIDKVLSIVSQRDRSSPERGHIALNTVERRGRFINMTPGWENNWCIDYSKDDAQNPDGQWQPGDWMGQVTGVPLLGSNCNDSKPPRLLRQEKIQEVLGKVIR
ncbi:MAG: ankyrin repeat domain-containing protein [Chlamydiales bacterium]